MGVVKTWNGIARASLKTFNGIAVASVKTINGFDATTGGAPTYTAEQTIGADNSNGSNIASAANRKFVGGSFTASATFNLTKVLVKILKATDGGSAGSITLELRADNSGSPASTVLETSSTSFAWADVGTSVANFEFLFSGTSAITNASVYWLVLKVASAGNATNYYLWRCGNTSSGEQENSELGTTTWSTLSTRHLYGILYSSP